MNVKIVLLLFLLVLCLPAWAQSDEAETLDHYKLPPTAVDSSSLQTDNGIAKLNGISFTGTAFLKYDNGTLKKAVMYKDGLVDGTTYGWYDNGNKMLLVTYKKGKLEGRYLAWYRYGAIMYNLAYQKGMLQSDQQFLDNSQQDQGADDDSDEEQDQDARNNSGE